MENATINLMVKDVNSSIKFYEDNLGFRQIMTVPETGLFVWAMVANGDVSIMFQEERNLKNEYRCLENNEINPSFTIYIKMYNVKKFYEQIKDKVKIVLDYHQTSYDSYEFAIRDNNGYILTFSES